MTPATWTCDYPGCDRTRLYGGISCPDHLGQLRPEEDE